ncbi:NUDIX domain-containing protein [Quadrisphaera granulorum]|uniref:NUDIX domain-containing protein n=1 Tax=Quadrisphaera granulorum TaxID=317664 RepID=A0A316A0N7_9ACTN|nr:NUDIX hydrolase [Quadrisphaera granulorum]PWJ51153.1 NUDIX domain-containing protein [Quadrisphaera granulorum]SZE97803.1 NUDIX domain-containing protein [Quadrisphaera granulorum]
MDLPPWLASAARPVTAAGALVLSPVGEVLLVEPTYKPTWEIPGGLVEPGESPAAACRREIVEELGLTPGGLADTGVRVGRLLCFDWTDSSPAAPALRLIYDGGVLDDLSALHLPPAELASARFTPLDLLDQRCGDRLARRIRAAVAALATGDLAELDDDGGPAA